VEDGKVVVKHLSAVPSETPALAGAGL